jgi:dihydrolipoamide dehydrogenase
MSNLIDVKVPDIGDFKDIPVIEVLVKVGDTVKKEDSLVSLESDKATMEVPSSAAGVVKEIKVKIGDKVSEGSVVVLLEQSQSASAASNTSTKSSSTREQVSPSVQAQFESTKERIKEIETKALSKITAPFPAGSYTGNVDITTDVLVLGAGPGGYSAAFRAADLGMKTVIIERYAQLGGVCLNVGCIPSKALLHVAAIADETSALAAHGITFGKPEIDLDKLRGWKEKVVGKLTGGLAGMAKARKVDVVRGVGQFLDANHIVVEFTTGSGQEKTGEKKVIRFEKAIIAAGSQVVRLPFIPDDPRIVDSTGALALKEIPKKLLVIGGGIIGLEMGTVYSTLGARLDVVEMMDGLMQGADRDLVKVWQKFNEKRFDNIMLKTKTVAVDAKPDGIYVTFETSDGKRQDPVRYDMALMSVGRSPNGKKISADKAGVAVTDRGFIEVDKQMRTNVPHIFAIGDIVGQPMLAHKAVHEGHVAAEAAAGQKSFFDARVIPSVAYTDPEVAWVGETEDSCKAKGIAYGKSVFPWAASGRAIANGRDEGFTKLVVYSTTHRVIGGGIVGTHAGDLIGEIALAIEMGCDPTDIGKTIHPHPTLGESIGMSAEVFEGVCTDLPPQKR